MSVMKNVVITGGSRGIGSAMASEFIQAGCRVLISGRSADHLTEVVRRWGEQSGRIFTHQGDISNPGEATELWKKAVDCLGSVDIWINNAGVGQDSLPVWEIPEKTVQDIVATNLTGLILACQAAFRGMRTQGYGCIFNMEGLGSDGRHMNNLTVYGTSKCAVRYFSEGLGREAAGSGVLIGTLSPGMVATDLLLNPLRHDKDRWKRNARFLNILADRPETVARFLVPRVLSNKRQNARINWLTNGKVIRRLLASLFVNRNVIAI